MQRILRSILVLSVAALGGCSQLGNIIDPDPVDGEAAERLQVWRSQNIDDYRFVHSADCFCGGEYTAPKAITVRDGLIVDARYVRTGEPVSVDVRAMLPTVEKVFDWIAEAQARDDYLDVKYHPQLGYPMEATIGTLANDAGTRHFLAQLQRID